jgi:hypothetical protein
MIKLRALHQTTEKELLNTKKDRREVGFLEKLTADDRMIEKYSTNDFMVFQKRINRRIVKGFILFAWR